jgi:hypothetical protein
VNSHWLSWGFSSWEFGGSFWKRCGIADGGSALEGLRACFYEFFMSLFTQWVR